MKYPCLVLDHDDTVVQSAKTIHYPAFMESLAVLRPDIHWSLEEYMDYNFEPGFEPLCRDILKLTPEENDYQEKRWYERNRQLRPDMFPGMAALIREYRSQGGLVCVISHSSEEIIALDYRNSCGFEPDYIFGWERGEGRRKPSPWPMQQLLAQTGLDPEQLLMVDDMKPGWQMAQECGVPFAFAGWGNPSAKAYDFMKEHAQYCLDRVSQLAQLLTE